MEKRRVLFRDPTDMKNLFGYQAKLNEQAMKADLYECEAIFRKWDLCDGIFLRYMGWAVEARPTTGK